MEAGCGCGVVLLGFALLMPEATCVGFDAETILISAASHNAKQLAIENHCSFITANAEAYAKELKPWLASADIFISNPPWRSEKNGRATQNQLRKNAYWAKETTFALFLRAAEFCMRNHALLCMILPVSHLSQLFGELGKTTLGLRELLPVASFSDAPAKRLLVLCKKGAADDFNLLPPLVIHERHKDSQKERVNDKICDAPLYTKEALEFCPWLKNR